MVLRPSPYPEDSKNLETRLHELLQHVQSTTPTNTDSPYVSELLTSPHL